MFNTALAQSRLRSVQRHVLLYLENLIKEQGADPNNFVLDSYAKDDQPGEYLRLYCKLCNQCHEYTPCDWNRNDIVDRLSKVVLQFSNDHRHGPMPVPSVEPVAAVVEYPKGYRKFREV